MKLALGIPHKPGDAARDASLARLLATLQPLPLGVELKVFDRPCSHWDWSGEMWTWACSLAKPDDTGLTHFLSLQDDAVVCDRFWEVLSAMIDAKPASTICLQTVHPDVDRVRERAWLTTSDGLIGVGYLLPIDRLGDFLDWRVSLRPSARESITEDTLLAAYHLRRDWTIWHPIPTPIDHDVSLPSTYAALGNDKHAHRRSPIRIEGPVSDTLLAFYAAHYAQGIGYSAGRFYRSTHHILRAIDEAYGHEDWLSDEQEYRRQFEQRQWRDNRPRITIATPTTGYVSAAHHHALLELVHDPAIMISPVNTYDCDVVRARARMVRRFLDGPATHLLFLDSDVVLDRDCLAGMLAAAVKGHGVVTAPYPKTPAAGHLPWESLAAKADPLGRPPQALIYRYAVEPDGPIAPDAVGCTPVKRAPLGCALISRAVALELTECCEASNECFDDRPHGAPDTANIFAQRGGRRADDADHPPLLSEDYSFCRLCDDLDIPIHMYLGPGTPLAHAKLILLEGMIEALGVTHQTPVEETKP